VRKQQAGDASYDARAGRSRHNGCNRHHRCAGRNHCGSGHDGSNREGDGGCPDHNGGTADHASPSDHASPATGHRSARNNGRPAKDKPARAEANQPSGRIQLISLASCARGRWPRADGGAPSWR
jgi:hypothetical protein